MTWIEDEIVVAVPTHRNRISPLFETARRLLLVRIHGCEELERGEVELETPGLTGLLAAIRAAEGDALVCGAIGNHALRRLLCDGLAVWPAASGEVDEVIACLAAKGALDERFMMPGLNREVPGAPERRAPFRSAFGRRWGWQELTTGRAGTPAGEREGNTKIVRPSRACLRLLCRQGRRSAQHRRSTEVLLEE